MEDDHGTRMLRAMDHRLVEECTAQASSRVLLTVEAAAGRLSIGRTTMYALIKTGAVESVLVGRLRRIPADALTHYLEQLRAAGAKPDHSAA